jgi:hypothetical protein
MAEPVRVRDYLADLFKRVENYESRELGLLDPMPLRLIVNGAIVMRGTLQEVQGTVAQLVTTWLAEAPELLAADALAVNVAFTSGTVESDIKAYGSWYTVVGALAPQAHRIKVVKEDEK